MFSLKPHQRSWINFPKKGDNSFKLWVRDYKADKVPWWTFPEVMLNRGAAMLWPWGEYEYMQLWKRWGRHTWYAPHNLWRVPFHFSQGFLITWLSALIWSPWPGIALVLVLAVKQEIKDFKKFGFHFKNIVDILDRMAGGALCLSFFY